MFYFPFGKKNKKNSNLVSCIFNSSDEFYIITNLSTFAHETPQFDLIDNVEQTMSTVTNSMNASNRWRITKNLLDTEEKGKEKRDEDRGGSIYQRSSPRFLFHVAPSICFFFILSGACHRLSGACHTLAIASALGGARLPYIGTNGIY